MRRVKIDRVSITKSNRLTILFYEIWQSRSIAADIGSGFLKRSGISKVRTFLTFDIKIISLSEFN